VSQPEFKVILVYDVSRWGRFQDSDESAHYEFICKNAGVPVHYCAETFANNGTISNSIMKALKRSMAAEYSRELGVKIFDGQKRLASLGFKQGGFPGYGLRRVLVSPDRIVKQELAIGERKSIATDRVILMPGRAEEVRCVREIYQMLLSGKCVYRIACELNRRRTKYLGDSEWDYTAVLNILTHVKYAGHNVFGRTSGKLYTPTVQVPLSEWTISAGAFSPIIDQATFDTAQRILSERTIKKSDAELLEALRRALLIHGRLSLRIIQNSANLPSPSTYRRRFGSLRSAYEKIGYGRSLDFQRVDLRARVQAMRKNLLDLIVTSCPGQVSIISYGGRWRNRLQLQRGPMISVMTSRCVRIWKNTIRWQIDPVQRERRLITVLARLDAKNETFLDFHILPSIDHRKRFTIKRRDTWLQRGLALLNFCDFCDMVETVKSTKNVGSNGGSL
jgi:hypothetical protein